MIGGQQMFFVYVGTQSLVEPKQSGIAEAACKTVVSTRAKRSDMRWTPKGLDALLALRTSVLNQIYGAFWQPRSQLVA
jgi:hypothetical protein